MTRTLIIAAAAAALAACDNSDHTIVANGPYDPQANEVKNLQDVELPPAIASSKIYRCKDNSVVYIDWLADNKSANFRPERTAPPTQLRAPEQGQPMVAEGGYSLTGEPGASTITLARPGAGSQSCKA